MRKAIACFLITSYLQLHYNFGNKEKKIQNHFSFESVKSFR